MKNKLLNIYYASILFLFSMQTIFAQCDGDNTFLGNVSSHWGVAANWSENCIPGSNSEGEIYGEIRILANCIVPPEDRANIKFGAAGKLILAPDVQLTNNSSGTWTITNIEGTGTYIGHLTVNRSIKPGYTPSSIWICGDPIVYGGQTYQTKQFGSQCWMASNLNIGVAINNSEVQIANDIIEKYCYNNLRANCDNYGGLYQWSEAMQYTTIESTKGICPVGFHIPNDDEWKILELFIGMDPTVVDHVGFRGKNMGSRLADNNVLWLDGELDQNEDFGSTKFNGLPAGGHNPMDGFFGVGSSTIFWTSGSIGDTPWMRGIHYNSNLLQRRTLDKTDAYSIRCVAD